MLSAPVVVPPLTPAAKGVHVTGTVPNSTVTIFADGHVVGEGPGARGIPMCRFLRVSSFRRMSEVVASQRTANDHSEKSAEAVGVLADPIAADLNGLFAPESLLVCGTSVWVSGVISGAKVSLTINAGAPGAVGPLLVDATTDQAKFVLPAGEKLNVSDAIKVQQTVQLAGGHGGGEQGSAAGTAAAVAGGLAGEGADDR
jgi:hypothetical protein